MLPTLPALLAGVLAVLHVLVCVLAITVLPRNRKPSTAMAWAILVFALPVVGIAGFLLIGNTTVGRRRRAWQKEIDDLLRASSRHEDLPDEGAGEWNEATRLNRTLGGLPLARGNTAEILPDFASTMEAMREEVAAAEHAVHVQFYIAAWDAGTGAFFDELVRAAERGVAVRLLLDHIGSRGIPGYKEFRRRLDASPIQWELMLPIIPWKGQYRRPDLRNHRKILVVDGTVGVAGSQNLVEPGYNKPGNHALGREWVDLMVRLRGPVVRQLDTVFATDWYSETGEDLRDELVEVTERPGDVDCQVVPSGPGYVTENNLRLFNNLIYGARSTLSITSPYFVPDESLLHAVTTAAMRGVEVELFVNAEADQFMVHHAQRSYYQALLEAGVRIWLYPAPAVLHAKHFTVDDAIAVVGSSNMDMRSFALDYEVVVMMRGGSVVADLQAEQDVYRSMSRQLTLEEWSRRSRLESGLDNVMRLTAALQ
ncbi:cardiolipin synthase [Brachybacterium sp. YJGR34]|uniref:cardiolipin synthase n=1 Tax=Brachybacterium sp. YJGR34 TaxID=2059911 RepID=UPI000E0C5020|nr:cardiolipin synthase [Brachybacterium sp. YJGR34]